MFTIFIGDIISKWEKKERKWHKIDSSEEWNERINTEL